MRPEPIHLLILLIVVIVIFGAAKLPSVAKNLGQSMKIFRNEVKDMRGEDKRHTETPRQLDSSAEQGSMPNVERQPDDNKN